MAYIIRDGEIVPVPIPVGKRVKIGSAYIPPLEISKNSKKNLKKRQ